MRRKNITGGPSKSPKTDASSSVADYRPTLQFKPHIERYARLSHRCFRETREIDWEVLREIGLKAKVQQLLSAGAWCQLFQITDNTYEQMVLEVLSTF